MSFWKIWRRGVAEIEWLVHAVRCAHPNLKLRRVLNRRGFAVQMVPGIGDVYRLVYVLQPQPEARSR